MQNYNQGYNQDYNQSNYNQGSYNQGSYNYGNYNQYPEYGPGYSDHQATGYNQQQSYNQQYQQVRPKTDDSLRDILTLVINAIGAYLQTLFILPLPLETMSRSVIHQVHDV